MSHQRIISVIGLGYVGLTTAASLSKAGKVIAYDINQRRIEELKNGHDSNDEVSDQDLKSPTLFFTHDPDDLASANFHIITVPTPLNRDKHPDFSMILSASDMLGKRLKAGDIVVYESTVYPGATEEICIPALEKASSLLCGKDFTVGYSPERINPSDTEHVFSNIVKVVSATDEATLDIISSVYCAVIKAGVFRASSIRVAEACKVIENTQRDVNIALMNDIAVMCHMLDIDISDVIAAMKTKWNAILFKPGLVGGHCIGVNSYYLMHKAEEAGYYSDIISAARRANEAIPEFIVKQTISHLAGLGTAIKGARIGVLGLTYKENCSDTRDTRVNEMINALEKHGATVLVNDPLADPDMAKQEYGIDLVASNQLTNLDAIILAVAHKSYLNLTKENFADMLKKNSLIMDIKSVLHPQDFSDSGIKLWRL